MRFSRDENALIWALVAGLLAFSTLMIGIQITVGLPGPVEIMQAVWQTAQAIWSSAMDALTEAVKIPPPTTATPAP